MTPNQKRCHSLVFFLFLVASGQVRRSFSHQQKRALGMSCFYCERSLGKSLSAKRHLCLFSAIIIIITAAISSLLSLFPNPFFPIFLLRVEKKIIEFFPLLKKVIIMKGKYCFVLIQNANMFGHCCVSFKMSLTECL